VASSCDNDVGSSVVYLLNVPSINNQRPFGLLIYLILMEQ